jgi:hypothetical protein
MEKKKFNGAAWPNRTDIWTLARFEELNLTRWNGGA